MKQSVIALGGGTVRYEWNRDILQGTGVRILLLADLRNLAERVRTQDRPRVNVGTSLEEDLKKIWEEHRDIYMNFADIIYDTNRGKTVAAEVEELSGILRIKGYIV